MKKKLSFILVFAMIAALFTGCSNNNNQSQPSSSPSSSAQDTSTPDGEESSEPVESGAPDNGGYNYAKGNFEKDEQGYPVAAYEYTMPLTENNDTLTLWTTCWTPQYIPEEGYASMEYPTFLREYTGVNIEYTLASAESLQQSFAVLLAADDLCDISAGGLAYYTGTVRSAIEDKWFVNLYDYMDYMPNYIYQVTSRDSVEAYSRVFYEDDIIPCFYTIYPDPLPATGYMCRKDWCDELGINVEDIITYDDIHEMLVGFKSLGVESPMEIYNTLEISIGILFAGFDTVAYASPFGLPYARVMDGQVEFTTTTDDDRDCMQLISDWYAEGLIDKNWSSYANNTDIMSVFTSNKTGYSHFSPGEVGDIEASTNDPDCTWYALPRPKKTEDQVLKFGQTLNEFNYGSWCISAKCTNIPLAVTYADWFYSEEGSLYGSYGVKGHTWDYDENGEIVLTSFVTNNPDGLGSAWVQCLHAMNALADAGMEVLCRKYAYPGGERLEEMHQAWVIEDYKGEYDFPSSVSFTDEQSEELNNYRNEIMTYINENYLAFVDGSKPMSEWDAYVEALHGMGLDRCVEIYQEAYESFMDRFEE